MKTLFSILLFSIAIIAFAQSANGFIKQGNLFYKESKFDLAEAQYRLALTEDPSSTEAQFNLSNALHQQKKYDEARQLLEKLQTLNMDSSIRSMSAYNQGVAYTKEKKLAESIAAYKQALRMNPDDKQARENLQKALQEQKKQQSQSQSQSQRSSMDESDADRKLRLLQEKEKKIRQRNQRNNSNTGGGGSKDW